MEHGVFKPSNPWPDAEPDSEQRGRVWRTWLLVLDTDVEGAGIRAFNNDPDTRIVAESQRRLVVRIRSDDPESCDVHEVMRKTREVFAAVDAQWQIATIQGLPKDRWLFMR